MSSTSASAIHAWFVATPRKTHTEELFVRFQLHARKDVLDVEYLERVADEMVDLDSESVRYTELAVADMNAPPGPVDFELFGPGAEHISAPQLPLQPVAAEDEQAHRLVRSIFEDIAVTRMAKGFDEATRVRTLAELDRLPVGHRGEMGRVLLKGLSEVRRTPDDETEWRVRRIVPNSAGGRTTHLAFGVCSRSDQMQRDLFGSWVQLRHHELYEQMSVDQRERLTTVGVVLTNRSDGQRPWDTTMFAVTGDLQLTEEDLALYRQIWSNAAGPGGGPNAVA